MVIRELLEISGVRKYLLLPFTKLLVEHFFGKGDKDLVTIIINAISIKTADLNIDSLYLLLSIYKFDDTLVLGVKKLFGDFLHMLFLLSSV